MSENKLKKLQRWRRNTRLAGAAVAGLRALARRYRGKEATGSATLPAGATLRDARFSPEPMTYDPADRESLDVWGFKDTRFIINDRGHVELTGRRYALSGSELTRLLPWIEDVLGLKVDARDTRPSHYGQGIPAPRRNAHFEEDLRKFLSEDQITADERIRQRHGHGHTQEEMYLIKNGSLPRVPDRVVYPADESQVASLVGAAIRRNVCLIPYGGGTNVTEALRCPADEERLICSIDMSRMNRVLWIDPINHTACIQAGAVGRHIMTHLARYGYTMGHEPDSIEFSTLGGWIATHASGMKKNKYGNIEDLIVDMNVVGPLGIVRRFSAGPRESTGIDPRLWMFGSEGNLGVVTQAVVKLFPLPEVKRYGSVIFPNFESGVQFMYELSRQSSWPASARLVDNLQFQLSMALKPADPNESAWHRRKSRLQKLFVTQIKGFDPDQMTACTLVFEGRAEEVQAQERQVYGIARRYGGLRGGGENGERGYQLTFGIAYIRDFMMNHYLMAESFETSMPWTRVHDVVNNVKRRVAEEHARRNLPGKPFVTARLTQIYETGAVIYFYFAFYAKDVPNPHHVFNEIEHAAREEILKSGGSLSHHHGVGKLRTSFMPQILSPAGLQWKERMKEALDPQNIFGVRNQYGAIAAPAGAPSAAGMGFFRRLRMRLASFFARVANWLAGGALPGSQTKVQAAPSPAFMGQASTSAAPSLLVETPVAEVLPAQRGRPSRVELQAQSSMENHRAAELLAPARRAAETTASARGYFSGKTVLVTGASSGIGRELALELARRGANVVAMARTEERLRSLQAITGQWMVRGDVSVEADCRFAIDAALKQYGRLDAVIHNAGVSMRGLAEETDLSVVDRLLATNFYPIIYMYQHAIDALRRSRGHFVGVSSMMGHFSTQLRSGYCASKHALQGYLDSVRLENAAHGVHVMSVAPGFVSTEITRRALNSQGESHDKESDNTAAGLRPDFVARRILRGIELRRRDVYPSRVKEIIGLGLSRVAPAVLDRIMLKSSVT
ncbi:MAG: SDR family oxidoreductase [Leptospirales bacterium]|nr:SDR family oxidoreductase [Leptospirales bacterium]